MRSRVVNPAPAATWLLVFEAGDEVVETLTRFAEEKSVDGASFTAVGALERAVLGYWDVARREYRRILVAGQVEVCSLIGNIARLPEGGRKLHAHAVLAAADGSTRGGHLLEGHVRPTLEVIVREVRDGFLRRQDEESGLALLE